MTHTDNAALQGGLTDAEKRRNLLRLVFDGSEERFADFCRIIREEIPLTIVDDTA